MGSYRLHCYDRVMSSRLQGLMVHMVVVHLNLGGEVQNHKTQLVKQRLAG